MARTVEPGSFTQTPPKIIAKTIVMDYTLGAYSGPEPPPAGIYEEKYTLTYPEGDNGILAGFTLQALTTAEVASGDTDSYDAFIWSETNDNFTVMLRRTDVNSAWSDDIQLTGVFFYE